MGGRSSPGSDTNRLECHVGEEGAMGDRVARALSLSFCLFVAKVERGGESSAGRVRQVLEVAMFWWRARSLQSKGVNVAAVSARLKRV